MIEWNERFGGSHQAHVGPYLLTAWSSGDWSVSAIREEDDDHDGKEPNIEGAKLAALAYARGLIEKTVQDAGGVCYWDQANSDVSVPSPGLLDRHASAEAVDDFKRRYNPSAAGPTVTPAKPNPDLWLRLLEQAQAVCDYDGVSVGGVLALRISSLEDTIKLLTQGQRLNIAATGKPGPIGPGGVAAARASGGPVNPGQPILVGDKGGGPELITGKIVAYDSAGHVSEAFFTAPAPGVYIPTQGQPPAYVWRPASAPPTDNQIVEVRDDKGGQSRGWHSQRSGDWRTAPGYKLLRGTVVWWRPVQAEPVERTHSAASAIASASLPQLERLVGAALAVVICADTDLVQTKIEVLGIVLQDMGYQA